MSNEILNGAHDFVLNNPQFHQTVNVTAGSGLEKLLKASVPEAFHDSGASDPPRCHPGTRLDYIDKICTWGAGTSQCPEHILWLCGAAGVGKSAIAQSCAELLVERDQLGATFFFSRPNQRDDPKCLFPSLSYQITTISDVYADILDRKLQRNPTLLEKSLARQFHELLVEPLEELRERREGMKDYVIIIDGLDECAGIKAQREIIEIVAKSVQYGTTPFRWAFFSRPESHIVGSFTSDHVRFISIHLEVPVSRAIDHEILCYLSAELKKIQEEHGLPLSWPSEKDLGALVDRSAGLFIYTSTVIRFVGDHNSLGPIAQLRRILFQGASGVDPDHPLSELDLFYKLIMQCVPSKILPLLQKILLLLDVFPPNVGVLQYGQFYALANSLNLSKPEIQSTCAVLRSVLKLDNGALMIRFYHASFMDFLKDQHRSGEFCIYGACLDIVRQELLERLNRIHAQSTEKLAFDLTWSFGEEDERGSIYQHWVDTFFLLCSYPRTLTSLTAAGLAKFQFMKAHDLYTGEGRGGYGIFPEVLRQNIPIELRNKVIRRSHNPAVYLSKPKHTKWDEHYILGQGKNRVVWWPSNEFEQSRFVPYPSALGF